jgi:formamidopyrimidine-DNA glycosylase
MPELPEVETTRRGIAPHLSGRRVAAVVVREPRLRWRVPASLAKVLPGQTLHTVDRRGKYLLLRADTGTVLIHLGMSGSLRVMPATVPPEPHDHVDLVLDNGDCLRLRDPRRFGCVLWVAGPHPEHHPLLVDLGPEPLSDAFTGAYLYQRARGRKAAVKSFIMDARVVVGVGNIYANEALFQAGIHPHRPAGRISRERYEALARAIKTTLEDAIRAGGTTLRDFYGSDGEAGYFALQLNVYGKDGQPCPRCGSPLHQQVIGQRSTYYCPRCQR